MDAKPTVCQQFVDQRDSLLFVLAVQELTGRFRRGNPAVQVKEHTAQELWVVNRHGARQAFCIQSLLNVVIDEFRNRCGIIISHGLISQTGKKSCCDC